MQGILPLRKLYAYRVLSYAAKKGMLARLPRTRARVNKYTYDFQPRSTRLLQSFHVHLVRLLNALPGLELIGNFKIALKTKLFDLDIDTTLTGMHMREH